MQFALRRARLFSVFSFIQIPASGNGGNGAVGGGGGDLSHLFGAAVACHEDGRVGGEAILVGDDVAPLVDGDRVFDWYLFLFNPIPNHLCGKRRHPKILEQSYQTREQVYIKS